MAGWGQADAASAERFEPDRLKHTHLRARTNMGNDFGVGLH